MGNISAYPTRTTIAGTDRLFVASSSSDAIDSCTVQQIADLAGGGSWSLSDGATTVSNVTSLLIDGATVSSSGTSGAATLTINTGSVAPLIVQQAGAINNGSGSPCVITFPEEPTPGNVILFFAGGHSDVITPPAGVGVLSGNVNASDNQQASAYYRYIESGDSNSWTFTQGTYGLSVFAYEIANAGQVLSEFSDLGLAPSSTATTTGVVPPYFRAGTLAFAMFEADSGTGATAANGWTLDEFGNPGGTGGHPTAFLRTLFDGRPPAVTWTGVTTTQPIYSLSVMVTSAVV